MRLALRSAVTLAAFGAFASLASAVPSPLLVKSSGSGFTPPEWTRSETCQVYADHVTISNRFGAIAAVEERKLAITGDVAALIKAAAAEAVTETPNGLCDGPSTVTMALQGTDADRIVLFSTGGCGSAGQERQGAASTALKGLVDQYCATTYKPMH